MKPHNIMSNIKGCCKCASYDVELSLREVLTKYREEETKEARRDVERFIIKHLRKETTTKKQEEVCLMVLREIQEEYSAEEEIEPIEINVKWLSLNEPIHGMERVFDSE